MLWFMAYLPLEKIFLKNETFFNGASFLPNLRKEICSLTIAHAHLHRLSPQPPFPYHKSSHPSSLQISSSHSCIFILCCDLLHLTRTTTCVTVGLGSLLEPRKLSIGYTTEDGDPRPSPNLSTTKGKAPWSIHDCLATGSVLVRSGVNNHFCCEFIITVVVYRE